MSARLLPQGSYPGPLDERELQNLERRVAAGGAKCRQPDADPDDWFPVGGENEHAPDPFSEKETKAEEARRLCAGCPVMASCLTLSLNIQAGQWGVWGGVSARERRLMVRSRTAVALEAAS